MGIAPFYLTWKYLWIQNATGSQAISFFFKEIYRPPHTGSLYCAHFLVQTEKYLFQVLENENFGQLLPCYLQK